MTPGPWHQSMAFIYGAEYVHVCTINYLDHETAQANARLIAAAPDLLAALERAQCTCPVRERDSGHKVDCWKPQADAAIERALKRTRPDTEVGKIRGG